MTDTRGTVWSADPPQKDIDDLIFLEQNDQSVSQR